MCLGLYCQSIHSNMWWINRISAIVFRNQLHIENTCLPYPDTTRLDKDSNALQYAHAVHTSAYLHCIKQDCGKTDQVKGRDWPSHWRHGLQTNLACVGATIHTSNLNIAMCSTGNNLHSLEIASKYYDITSGSICLQKHLMFMTGMIK